MFEMADLLGRAGRIRAPRHRFARRTHDRALTDGALRRHREFPLCAGALRVHNLDDFGNHVPGALNDNRIADTDVFALDFVLIVQRGAAHQDAFQRNRL